MIKRGKRGQFYLIVAIIIISIIVGFFVIQNYARTEKQGTRIYDLGEEFDLETGRVYDYGVYNQKDQNELINNWTNEYYNYTQGDIVEDWIFIYGNKKNLTLITFTQTDAGTISIFNTEYIISKGEKTEEDITDDIDGNKVEITFKEQTYEFKLTPNENFFFVISSEGLVSTQESEKELPPSLGDDNKEDKNND